MSTSLNPLRREGSANHKRFSLPNFFLNTRLEAIREPAEGVKVRHPVEISPGPKDEPFFLCPEVGKADFIFTLNPKHFPRIASRRKCCLQVVLRCENNPRNFPLLNGSNRALKGQA